MITSLLVALNGSLLILGAEDGSIKGWDFLSRDLRFSQEKAHEKPILWMSILDDSQFRGEDAEKFLILASGSEDGTVLLWEISQKVFSVHQITVEVEMDLQGLFLTSFVVAPNQAYAVSVASDRSLCAWDVSSEDFLTQNISTKCHFFIDTQRLMHKMLRVCV